MSSRARSTAAGLLTLLALSLPGSASVLAQDAETPPPATPLEGMERGPLAAGTYADDSLGPIVTFSVEEGWDLSGPPIEEVGFDLMYGDSGPAAISVVRFDGIVFGEPCLTDGDVETYIVDTLTLDTTPEAFMQRLAENPFLTTSEPVSVIVGGAPGLQVDLTSAIGAECDPPVTFLWELPVVGEFHLNDGESARVIALDVGGDVVVVFIEAFPGVDYPPFLEAAMSVVETMDLTPAGG